MRRLFALKFVFSVILVLFFTSCENLYFSDNYDVARYTSKTTIKDFSEVNDPIVITMPVYGSKHFLGMKSFSENKSRVGDVFVVIDWENEKVFDWVFQGDKYGSVNWRCVELGTDPKYYCTASSGSEHVYYLKKGKTSVISIDSGVGQYFESSGSAKPRGLLWGNNMAPYKVSVFDMEKKKVVGDMFSFNTDDSVNYPVSDEDGNFWLAYQKEYQTYISKIDTISLTTEKFPVVLPNIGTEPSDPPNSDIKDSYSVQCVHDGLLYLSRIQRGLEPYEHDPVLILINTRDSEPQKNMKKVYFSKDIIPNYDYDYHYIYKSVFYQNNLYVVVSANHGLDSDIYIFEINPVNDTNRLVAGPINFDMTENIWLRDSRIYFMCSRYLTDISYLYCDLETGEIGQKRNIRITDLQ